MRMFWSRAQFHINCQRVIFHPQFIHVLKRSRSLDCVGSLSSRLRPWHVGRDYFSLKWLQEVHGPYCSLELLSNNVKITFNTPLFWLELSRGQIDFCIWFLRRSRKLKRLQTDGCQMTDFKCTPFMHQRRSFERNFRFR